MASHSDTKWGKKIIGKIANKTSRTYPSYCVDNDDLVQTGWIGFLKALSKKGNAENSFRPYTYITIARAIRREGLKSIGILQAPYRARNIVAQVYVRLKDGENIGSILVDLKISTKEWVILQRLLRQYSYLDKSKHPTIDAHSDFSFILRDIFDIPTLTDTEKEIILARINDDQESLGMSRTTIWKHLKVIREKLARGGYVV